MASKKHKEKAVRKKSNAQAWANKQDQGFTSTTVKLPEGREFFSLKKTGIVKVDIIPFIAGDDNPNADPGVEHFERTFEVHRGLGLEGKSSYCCLSRTFKDKCPICQDVARNGGNMDEELVKKLRPQTRQLWNVCPLEDNPERKVKVWDVAYFKSFGQLLKNKLLAVEEYGDFADLENGKTLVLTVEELKMPGTKFNAVTNIEIVPRKKQYDEDFIENAVCLDEVLIRTDYDDLKKIYSGLEDEPSSQSKPETIQEDDDDTDEDDEDESDDESEDEDSDDDESDDDEDSDEDSESDDEEDGDDDEDKETVTAKSKGLEKGDYVIYKKDKYEIRKISGDGTSLTLEDDDGNEERAVDPADVEKVEDDDEDEDEDEKPKKKKK